MAVRFAARQRAPPCRNWAQLQTPGDNTSTLVLDSNTPSRNLAAAGPRAGCGDGGRICNPAAARPRPQCVGKRILVGRLRDRPRSGAVTRRARGSIRTHYHRGLGSRDRHAGQRRHRAGNIEALPTVEAVCSEATVNRKLVRIDPALQRVADLQPQARRQRPKVEAVLAAGASARRLADRPVGRGGGQHAARVPRLRHRAPARPARRGRVGQRVPARRVAATPAGHRRP